MTETAYLAPSALDVSDGPDLTLATALGRTPAGDVWHPTFFTGFAARPDVTAAGLLAVADVAASRYADLGLAKRLANLDPVVTASGDRLRFESFSACNGVYARFDLLPDGIDSGEVGFGTTNVDVNPPLRAALASVPRGELLHLAVGSDELRVSTPADSHAERKVPLPDRWVRGFAETPLLSRATETGMELTGRAVATFLGSLPRISSGPGRDVHLLPVGPVPRVVPAQVPGRRTPARVAAPRGRPPGRPLRHRAHRVGGRAGHDVVALRGARRRADPAADTRTPGAASPARAACSSCSPTRTPSVSVARSSATWPGSRWSTPTRSPPPPGTTAPRVDAGLAWLSSSGRLGYDIDAGRWFHRELPVNADRILRDNPRLRSARAITGLAHVSDGWRGAGHPRRLSRQAHAATGGCAPVRGRRSTTAPAVRASTCSPSCSPSTRTSSSPACRHLRKPGRTSPDPVVFAFKWP